MAGSTISSGVALVKDLRNALPPMTANGLGEVCSGNRWSFTRASRCCAPWSSWVPRAGADGRGRRRARRLLRGGDTGRHSRGAAIAGEFPSRASRRQRSRAPRTAHGFVDGAVDIRRPEQPRRGQSGRPSQLLGATLAGYLVPSRPSASHWRARARPGAWPFETVETGWSQ